MRHRFVRYKLIRHKLGRHKFMGAGTVVLAVAVALAVSGCGGHSDHNGKKQPTASVTGVPTAAPAQTGTAAATGTDAATATSTATGTGSASPDESTQGVGGVWLATQGSAKVQLVLGNGEAGLTSTSLCGGSYSEKGGISLKLTCMDGNKDRINGRGVLAADGRTLTVQWAGGPTDTFTRTGLPSN